MNDMDVGLDIYCDWKGAYYGHVKVIEVSPGFCFWLDDIDFLVIKGP